MVYIEYIVYGTWLFLQTGGVLLTGSCRAPETDFEVDIRQVQR